jgi:hypothetical protein
VGEEEGPAEVRCEELDIADVQAGEDCDVATGGALEGANDEAGVEVGCEGPGCEGPGCEGPGCEGPGCEGPGCEGPGCEGPG